MQENNLMTKTMPFKHSGDNSAKNNFFNNFAIESIDDKGRTSLR